MPPASGTTTPVSISAFTTTFTFQMLAGTLVPADRRRVHLHDSERSERHRGPGQAGGGLGFGTDGGGPIINNSVAIKFDAYKPGGDHSSTGLYVEGDLPAAGVRDRAMSTFPLDGTGSISTPPPPRPAAHVPGRRSPTTGRP